MEYSLNGKWKLRCLQTGEIIPAQVPGDITADCYAAKIIPDPYFGMNYKDERFILERDYEYSLEFNARKVNDDERCILSFGGIDTFAEISLNGELLGKTENMFLRYEYDVTKLLKDKNILCVRMRSTLKHMDEIDAEKYFACFNKERIFVRKAQCHFSWDWAPDLPGYGIWEDVTLCYRPETRISEVRYRTDCEGNVSLFTELNYSVRKEEYFQYASSDTLRYTIEAATNLGLEKEITLEFPVTGAKNFCNLFIKSPALWMPVGYGKPNLYSYKVELLRNGAVVDCYDGKLAFRTVELEEKPISESRMSFRLKINGEDVFVKGSNWVPCECFTGTVQTSRYEKLIKMAADAGINMLRVWGGGIYEKEIFYRLCDELGIMVWQDFMFACADIPETDAKFVANVTQECIYQVKRLRNHPCIVYWCGGNEKTGSCGLMKQYGDNLVDVTLRGIAEHYDGTRPYVRQSPSSLTDNGNDSESGETHGTAFDVATLNSYNEFLQNSFNRDVSFASECAIMGSCVPESYQNFVPKEKMWPLGEIQEDRFSDNPYGSPPMRYVKMQQKMSEMMFGPFDDLNEFAVKSMAVQAEALKVEILNARRKRKQCGGFMNWMYDDIWPTGTWSVIDYYLRPKASYYTLKREYAPFRAAVISDGNGEFFGYIINDTKKDLQVELSFGGVTVDGDYGPVTRKSERIKGYSVLELGKMQAFGDVLYISYSAAEFSGTAFNFITPFKQLSFESEYSIEISECEKVGEEYRTKIVVTANKYVRMLHVSVPDGTTVSDDWFDVLPNKKAVITVISNRALKQEEIKISDYGKYIRKK